MKSRSFFFVLLAATLGISACTGSQFGGGTAIPGGVAPPVNSTQAIPGAQPTMTPPGSVASPAVAASSPPASHPFSQASTTGIPCPTVAGFGCTFFFNQPPETPAPSPTPSGKGARPTATPSPTPTPTPTPTASAGASTSPTPSPTPAAEMNLTLVAMPKDVPSMVNPDPKALATKALAAVTMSTTADVLIQGRSSVIFTLPKEQIGGRGFAIQLYQETVRKKRLERHYVGSYNVSTIKDGTLRFAFNAPKLVVKKGETWLVVLYGDELPVSASASPSALPMASPSASPSATP